LTASIAVNAGRAAETWGRPALTGAPARPPPDQELVARVAGSSYPRWSPPAAAAGTQRLLEGSYLELTVAGAGG
jgi:hypothetical protein